MRGFRKLVSAIAKSCVFVGALAASPLALAEDFPSKPVTLVVPYAPGGSNDVNARYLADKLSKLWATGVVIENRGGAGSTIGTAHVTRAKADGYTLLFNSSSYATSAATQASIPYDPVNDLKPINYFGSSDMYLLVGKNSPIKNVADLKREAERRIVFAGSAGVGTISHLAHLLFDDAVGIKSEIVQYTGGGDVIADLAGGRIDIFIAAGPTAANSALKPIAVMGKERSAEFPEVPTIVEEGYPDAMVNLWFGLFAPKDTPDEIVEKVSQDLSTTMKNSAQDDYLKSQGIRIIEASSEDFDREVKSELERWTALAVAKGIRK